jgi:uncharacterized protein YndB with AHSA1/START domain
MTMIMQEVTINAPVEKVFSFLIDPRNLPEIWPNFIEVKNVKKADVGGHNFDWTYKMSGMRFEGKTETIEFVQNERLVTRATKGIESTLTWKLLPERDRTRLSVEIHYTVPTPLANRLKEQIVVQENEHEARAMIENLKTKVELEPVLA